MTSHTHYENYRTGKLTAMMKNGEVIDVHYFVNLALFETIMLLVTRHFLNVSPHTECDVPVPGIFHFFGGIGTGIGTNWYRKKVSEPVSEKFGIREKSRNRCRKNLVPGKSHGAGIGKIWYRKKSQNRYWNNLIPKEIFVAKI